MEGLVSVYNNETALRGFNQSTSQSAKLKQLTLLTHLSENRTALKGLEPGSYLIQISKEGILTVSIPGKATSENKIRERTVYGLAGILFLVIVVSSIGLSIQFRKNRSLQTISKSNEQLLQIIAHDLRSPVNHFQGLTEILHDLIKNKQYDRLERIGKEIEETNQRLGGLINSILAWTNSREQKHSHDTQKQLFADITNDIVPIYEVIARSKGIVLKQIIDKNVQVAGDKNVLSLIIRNIIDNAIKHAPPYTEVSIAAEKNGSHVIFYCKNKYNPGQEKALAGIVAQINNGKLVEDLKAKGYGLRFINEFARMLKGNIEMSLDGEFATWRIAVPSYI